MCFHFLHLGHLCGQAIMIGRTRGDGRIKARKQRKIHSARRALWRRFSKFGVDWELLDMRDKIRDMKHARQTSKLKCKINDVHERVINNLKLQSLKIDKQPRLSVKPRLCTFNVEAKMFHKKSAGRSQVKFKASSKRKASGISPTFILRTSPDDVTHFFSYSLVLGRCHLERSWLERSRVYQRKIFSIGRSTISFISRGDQESSRRRNLEMESVERDLHAMFSLMLMRKNVV